MENERALEKSIDILKILNAIDDNKEYINVSLSVITLIYISLNTMSRHMFKKSIYEMFDDIGDTIFEDIDDLSNFVNDKMQESEK